MFYCTQIGSSMVFEYHHVRCRSNCVKCKQWLKVEIWQGVYFAFSYHCLLTNKKLCLLKIFCPHNTYMFSIFYFKLQCWYVYINKLFYRKNDLIFIIMWFVIHVGNDGSGFFCFVTNYQLNSNWFYYIATYR